ncbi:MAG: cation diffusion facilitator family transporter [Amnibacterium sp.]
MSHGHDHGGGDGAHPRLAIALGISGVLLAVEVVGAALTGSLALLVDAGHVLADAGGLAVALAATRIARRPATARHTWGFARAEVLAATAQSAVLLGVGLFVLVEGIRRLIDPPAVDGGGVLVFGVLALLGNGAAVAVLAGGRSASFNLRAAFLEVLNDALGAVGVIVAAVVLATTGWLRADAVAAILIGALILPRAAGLLRETVDVLLESTPPGLDLEQVRSHLLDQAHVLDVHDLHASTVASGLPVLTAHVILEDECFTSGHTREMLDRLQACVAEHFPVAVEHSTFQLEPAAHREHERTPHG